MYIYIYTIVVSHTESNTLWAAANPMKSLENALLAVKYGARNALHSQVILANWYRVGTVSNILMFGCPLYLVLRRT